MKLRDNWYQRVMHLLALVLFLGLWGSLLLCWRSLPDRIPTHYDFAGNIDGWGGKASLLMLPVIGTLVEITMVAVEQYPQVWNTGVRVTPQNQVFVYRTLKSMLATLEASILGMFLLIHLFSLACAPLPVWALAAPLALVLFPVVFFLVRLAVGSRRF